MSDNIIEFKKKPTFKEKVKNWWDDHKGAVIGTLVVVGFIFVPAIINSVSNKNSPVNDGQDDPSDSPDIDRDFDAFAEETDDEVYILDYDSGIHTSDGHNPKTIAFETDFSNLGYIGEQIIKHFDVDPDEGPYVCIDFVTFSKKDTDDQGEMPK